MVAINRFRTANNSSSSAASSNTLLTNKILHYLESGFLLFLTASIYASPYITSKTYNSYLQVFTMIFIVIQSYMKARNVITQTEDIKSKSSIIKLVSFIGAFVVAMFGFKELNLNSVISTSKLWTALALSNFSYGVSDIIVGNGNISDLVANGICALLLLTGGVALYFEKNIMGICCLLSLVIKSMKGFCVKDLGKRGVQYDYWYPLAFSIISLAVIAYCYVRNVNLDIPKLFDFFKKTNEVVNQ